MIEEAKKIAIVGLGPKGLYGLERLLANLAQLQISVPVEIHLFNKTTSFGAGPVYDPKQPTYLKMNYVNGYINMWPEQKPKPIIPNPKSYVQWLADRQDDFSEASAYTFSSRASVGRYLSDGFKQLLAYCPEHVSIIKHTGDVIDIDKVSDEYKINYRRSVDNSVHEVKSIHNILIATGHPCINDPTIVDQNNHIDFIYPVDTRLANITPGSKVAIKGMGLTFIDAVLALTEGRKGEFEKDENGVLSYVKSGLEPDIIYPYSKSGLPMIPRGNTFDKPAIKPFYFKKESFEFINALEGKYDFERQLLPLIEQEFMAIYYSAAFKSKGLELVLSKDFSEVKLQIEDFHRAYSDIECFDFHAFLGKPLEARELNKSTLDYIQMSIEEAEIGIEKSPFAATADVWRHLSEFYNELYKFGGLKPQSHKTFLEKYAGQLNRITYGPPIENMKKIFALAKAGLVDFSFSQSPTIEKNDSYFLLSKDSREIHINYLVDARIPKVQLHQCTGELYGNLINKELIHPYVNRLEGRLDFRPGCLSLNEYGHPIDETGFANEAITFTGTPTEGLTYDNDTLSRKRNDFVSAWAKNLVEKLFIIEPQTELNTTSY